MYIKKDFNPTIKKYQKKLHSIFKLEAFYYKFIQLKPSISLQICFTNRSKVCGINIQKMCFLRFWSFCQLLFMTLGNSTYENFQKETIFNL